MMKKTLSSLFAEWLFRVPDYQRGYAWEAKQWNDFIEDIDALVNEDVKNHYTGTVVTYQDKNKKPQQYGPADLLSIVDVVDGQQRLTTCCLYLSIILNALVKEGVEGYRDKIPNFLYAGAKCRLTLNNDTEDFYYNLLKTGHPITPAHSTHQKRLLDAYTHFKSHADKQVALKGTKYLTDVYYAITGKLVFTFYTIEEESEIGMTFELMNSRGKDLSVLELLKNYLMHWISRNLQYEDVEKHNLTALVNRNWKHTYTNIGLSEGSEDQCLRIAWILYCSPTPKNWSGYQGFKEDLYFPLRNFSVRSKDDTKQAIEKFANGLAEVSRHYACIISPNADCSLAPDEQKWLNKIQHGGNIANFLPLMTAARICCERNKITPHAYVEMLEALEMFAYRVFLFGGKRGDAGRTSFFRWAYDLFAGAVDIETVNQRINNLVHYYIAEEDFQAKLQKPFSWYRTRNLLKYTLYEYELHLLKTEGKGKTPTLKWEDLSDSTIEHIYPQNPSDGSQWKKSWDNTSAETYLHDIGNLVLTQNNSNYSNFDFQRKKKQDRPIPSYANSDIRQERNLFDYMDWTPVEVVKRRTELIEWITERWKTNESLMLSPDEIGEVEVEDSQEGDLDVTL